MKILFVCFPYSVHAARYVGLLKGQGWDIHVFPAQDFDALHVAFDDVTYWPATTDRFIPVGGQEIRVDRKSKAYRNRLSRPDAPLADYLEDVLKEGEFDIVHSMEFQHASYLAHKAVTAVANPPIWIATNYGSDIYLYGRQPEHEHRIRAVLSDADFYAAECRRDVPLARDLGFSGRLFSLVPNSGGIDLAQAARCSSPGPTSQRRAIAVKGYQHFAGRALTVLEVLDRDPDLVRGYEVNVYAPSTDVAEAAISLGARHRLDVIVWPEQAPHEEILRLHGRSRVSIGISLSDGISTSFLEAMAMGALPIQSDTACANEWIVDGSGGILVDPRDHSAIAEALRRALSDDAFVDRAAEQNALNIKARADSRKIGEQLVRAYSVLELEVQERRRHRLASEALRVQHPRLTVITPTYNRADYLGETIDSVLSQSFRDFTFIIIDDGSQDETAAVIARFSDERIKFFRHDNVGEVRTVNRGLRMVESEYFTVVNSDDPLLPGSFAEMIQALDSHPDRLMAYPDWIVTGPAGEELSTVRLPPYDARTLITLNSISLGPGAVFRSTALDSVGLRNPLLRYSADLDYIHRLSLLNEPLHVAQVLATHRTHPSSGIVASKGARMASEVALLRDTYGRHPANPQSKTVDSQGYVNGRMAAAHTAADFRTASRLILRAFLRYPVLAISRLFLEQADYEILFRAFPDSPSRLQAAAAQIDKAWRGGSRIATVNPSIRAFLHDPIACLQFLKLHGEAAISSRIRGLEALPSTLAHSVSERDRRTALEEQLVSALSMADQGDVGSLRTLIGQILVEQYPSVESWTRLGESQQAAGRAELAAASFEEARRRLLGATNPALLLLEGEARSRAGDSDSAINLMQEFVRTEPNYPLGRYYLASCLANSGRLAEASEIFSQNISIGLQDGRSTTTGIIDLHKAADLTAEDSRPFPIPRELGPFVGLREPKNVTFVLFVSCDETYFSLFFEPVLRSFQVHAATPFLVHLHVINPSPSTSAAAAALGENLGVPVNVTWEFTALAEREEEERRTYLSCARYIVAGQLRRVYRNPIVITDMDQTLRGPIQSLLERAATADVSLLYFPQAEFNFLSTISASVFVASPTHAAQRFLDHVGAYILEQLHKNLWAWHLDQAALNAVRLLEADLSVNCLPPEIMESRNYVPKVDVQEPALFWSVTYSVKDNAKKLSHPELAIYRDGVSAMG